MRAKVVTVIQAWRIGGRHWWQSTTMGVFALLVNWMIAGVMAQDNPQRISDDVVSQPIVEIVQSRTIAQPVVESVDVIKLGLSTAKSSGSESTGRWTGIPVL